MSTNKSIANVLAMVAQRIAGLQKWGAQLGPQVPIEGQTYTVDQLVAIYTATITDRTNIASAKAALLVLLATADRDNALRAAVDGDLKAALIGKFGSNSQAVLDCGYVKAVKKPTVEAKASAVAQAAETRKLFHSMGKAQRKAAKKAAAQAAAGKASAK